MMFGGRPVATDSPLAEQYYGKHTMDLLRQGTPSANPADIMAGVAPFTPGMPIPFGNFDQGQVNNFMWANPGSFRLGNTGTVIGNNATGGGGVNQDDLTKMIQSIMDPYLKQITDYQTKMTDLYNNRNSNGGPFGFLNAPMTFNKPIPGANGQLEFRRVSYGAPENRGFNPGGYPQFNQQPAVPSLNQSFNGMFTDPFLLKLAETLFPSGTSWLLQPTTPTTPAGVTGTPTGMVYNPTMGR